VPLLLVKLTLAPAFVVGASLVARRFGPRVGGIVGGLPVVAGPILLVFAVEHGTGFAAHAAAATLLGMLSLTAFAVGYAVLAGRLRWRANVLVGWAVFAACTVVLRPVPTSAPLALVLALAGFAGALAILPHGHEPATAAPSYSRWDLPVRAVAAAALVVALTGVSGRLGPDWSGLVATFPVITTVLAAFTHAQRGASDTRRLLRGFLTGFVSYALFLFALSLSIERLGTAAAFALATAIALATQALLLVSRRAPS
jgi:uncharacterized membrane protein (GlpM family)